MTRHRPPAATPVEKRRRVPFVSERCMDRQHAKCRQGEARPAEPNLGIAYDPCSCACHQPEQAPR